MLKPFLRFLAVHSLPHQWLCKPFLYLINHTHPSVSRRMIDHYIRSFALNMSEAECEDIRSYPSLAALFIRRLKPQARPISGDEKAWVSPVDGELRSVGCVESGTLLQAKGKAYSLAHLIGSESPSLSALQGAFYATFYLSPLDYHRVHMPITGTLRRMAYIPGRLFSVDADCERNIDYLYTRNERVVYEFDTAMGRMVYVMVGAFMVGGIHAVWHGDVRPQGCRAQVWHYQPGEVELAKGDELGYFKFGSSIVLLAENREQQPISAWCSHKTGQHLHYGTLLSDA